MADWDSFAIEYDRIFLEYPQYVEMAERFGRMVAAAGGGAFRVLDIGSGTGNVSYQVLEKSPGARVVGLDPSEGMRELFAKRFEGRSNSGVEEGSATAIPFGDGEFDCVVTNLALHHVPPSRRPVCAAEIARVLRPGGLLLYGDMFLDVDGDPRDPARARDVIGKMTAVALYCLEHGAYDMMMIILKTMPADIACDGEFMTTPSTWVSELESAGFGGIEVTVVPPEQHGLKIISAVLMSGA